MKKWVYFFGAGKSEGDGEWRDLLGGKGAGLAEMTRIGLPVPAGFTISTETCDYFYKNGKKYPSELKKQVVDNVKKLEKVTGKKLGDPKSPLLVSVRSGSARSMPGMMETILNLGLHDKSVDGLAKATKNERFAYDAYRRFVQMYSTVVMGMSKEDLEHRLRAIEHIADRVTGAELVERSLLHHRKIAAGLALRRPPVGAAGQRHVGRIAGQIETVDRAAHHLFLPVIVEIRQ